MKKTIVLLFINFRLHLKLNTRAAELKQLVLLNFTDSVGKIHDNRKIFLDIQKKVKYYIKLVEIILEHYDIHVIIKLSKYVVNKFYAYLTNITQQLYVLDWF